MNKIQLFAGLFITSSLQLHAQDKPVTLQVDWSKVISVSKTTPTLQLVENPMVRPSSPIHKATFAALKELGADYVRYVPWFPYPKMAVAELKAPTKEKTSWDFTYADSTMEALMNATAGHSVVINFSTTPAWMWENNTEVKYPDDPYQVFWDYNPGTRLRDTTVKELAQYFARLVSWYTKGGFADELGVQHKSNHFYKIPYWEVLNEPDLEHDILPQQYTKMYDAIVTEIKKVSPASKFIGISVAFNGNPEWFEYFLNPKNHLPNIPLDGISYHFYATPSFDHQKIEDYQYTFFEKANAFLEKVRYIENIRKRLSPNTITTINEIGSIIGYMDGKGIPDSYWNLSGATYAYLYVELTKMGIDVAGESQLVGYPTQFPDVSMMNWSTAQPNARYWILKMIKENFGPGDKLVATSITGSDLICQAFNTAKGKKILVINPRNKEVLVTIPGAVEISKTSVDVSTADNPASLVRLNGNFVKISPYEVAVITIN